MEFSNQYLTYEEYQGLGGNLAEMPFSIQEFKARQKINDLTFGKLKGLNNQIQEVKLCVYELINQAQLFEISTNQEESSASNNIASEKVGDYSVTYSNPNLTIEQNISLNKDQQNIFNNIIRTYLSECRLDDGTPYLYRG